MARSLVPILATKTLVMPPAKDSIMMGRFLWLFRHLKHQNLSTGDGFVQSSGIIFLVPFLATKEALVPLANNPMVWGRSIRSFRHLKCQNLFIISYSIGFPNGSKKMGKK